MKPTDEAISLSMKIVDILLKECHYTRGRIESEFQMRHSNLHLV